MALLRDISIGTKKIGQDHPPFTIAELSGNHAGDINKALDLIRAAAKAGADAIKLQVYRADTITLKSDKPDFQIPKGQGNKWESYGTLYELYEYAYTPWEWLPELFAEAHRLGVNLFGSVFDETSVDELEKFNVPAYKIASPEVFDIGLLIKVAQTGKPVIISTGLASLADLDLAVRTLREHGTQDIIILKCTTAYPTPFDQVDLRTIPNLQQTFNCHAGLSDHTLGISVPIAATALGAAVIEKHIKLDEHSDSVDSFFSLTVDEFKLMVESTRQAFQALGSINYDLPPESYKNRKGTRSLYVCADIKKGEVFTEKNIKSVRPGYGLHTKYKSEVIGKVARKDLTIGDRLEWGVIE
ncbi:pseudaminic acid synthase [Thiomicrospira microaerophila]|uniref:pseudaminic acid synthase n=1 Tax=Thiomicrospira microaerophila TaxID=406020 RepID=UPI00200C579B|nr:pseudaminic acid synthase [Thiomicrospira microaerophila]UQB42709.1 pseudaminic acid synthase [Thiomicrospira microaerophila]